MNQMRQEIRQSDAARDVRFLGINESGQEAGNPEMYAGRVLPWLQDRAGQEVWESWDVTYRDVVIVDEENRKVAVYNVTVHDLAVPAAYDSLKTLLLGYAAR